MPHFILLLMDISIVSSFELFTNSSPMDISVCILMSIHHCFVYRIFWISGYAVFFSICCKQCSQVIPNKKYESSIYSTFLLILGIVFIILAIHLGATLVLILLKNILVSSKLQTFVHQRAFLKSEKITHRMREYIWKSHIKCEINIQNSSNSTKNRN